MIFKGHHFDRSVILLCVRWYLAYSRDCQLGAEEAKLPWAQPSREYMSAHESNTSRIAPGEEGAIAGGPVLTGREAVTAEVEVVVDRAVNRETAGPAGLT